MDYIPSAFLGSVKVKLHYTLESLTGFQTVTLSTTYHFRFVKCIDGHIFKYPLDQPFVIFSGLISTNHINMSCSLKTSDYPTDPQFGSAPDFPKGQKFRTRT